MALTVRNAVVLAKIEVTPGTDPTPVAATDALLANAAQVTPQPTIIDTTEFAGTLDVGEPIIGVTPMEITLQVFAKGSGTVDAPPEYGPLLRACAMAETINAATSVVYDPASTSLEYVTIYIYRDGLLWDINGCQGTFTLTMTSGQLWVFDFTFTGIFGGKTDVAVPSPTLDTTRPQPWLGDTFTIGGSAAALQAISVSLNNTIAIPDNPNAAEGFDVPQITQRDIQGTMNPLETLVATRNIFSDFRAGTTRALQAIVGATTGNIITLDVPTAKYRGETQGDRDGLLTVDVPFSAVSTDDGIKLTYT